MQRRKLLVVCCSSISLILLMTHRTSWPLPSITASFDAEVTIFIVTPTFRRPTQLADMTRLCNTVRHLSSVYWIVVDDSNVTSVEVDKLLEFCSVPYVYFSKQTPAPFANGKKFGRGVDNRNAALAWIRNESARITGGQRSVIYFADDDNAYDVRLFDEIRKTKKISMFPVGSIGLTGLSTPVVHTNGSLLGFHDPFYAGRKFPIDMAGFALSTESLLESSAEFEHKTGYLEDSFLRRLNFEMSEIEFLAENCTRILVWHVKTVPATPIQRQRVLKTLKKYVSDSNLEKLFHTYA